ncbi:hypothetical protein H257_04949 [Aphanomyces astaci]|uniref:Uncharacterized protein n=1 Tax=Aphanomyces astaci TaxID=112090 RepID=W4GTB9_APHAT|nr:hypothetical protein H257_04949 [Aphanomyces astaci]ETV82249.1 hypothetical protein H257_04949 [Aphanomyces astaci]|eukprot:XP_009827918.1 hypothetical protein H257_04949 [Aphanomyces astaci]
MEEALELVAAAGREGPSNSSSLTVHDDVVPLKKQVPSALRDADALDYILRRSSRQPGKSGEEASAKGMLWCDRSVTYATLFSLRYNSPLASRFDSKYNYGKRVAYVMLGRSSASKCNVNSSQSSLPR